MSFIRNAVFLAKGMSEFTKNGFLAASKSFDPKDLQVDLRDRVFMITGANSGIGKCTALELAKRGGAVHMVCRDKQRGEKALSDIKDSTNNENVYLHLLDMSSPYAVEEFAKRFSESNSTLDVLVNNAGCMVQERIVDNDGLEKNFATNVLGVYILTTSLLPLLERSQDARVIMVSSGGMLTQKLNHSDLQSEKMNKFDGTAVYAQNKRQMVVMTQQLAQKHTNVHFSCMHPGWADTLALQEAMPGFYNSLKDRLRTPEEGADTVVWLAAAADIKRLPSGLFFLDRKAVNTHLPLSWTATGEDDERLFMKKVDKLAVAYQKPTSSQI